MPGLSGPSVLTHPRVVAKGSVYERARFVCRTSALVLAVSVAGCGGSSVPAPSACVDRAAICADELLEGRYSALTDNGFYLPGADAAPAAHPFSGTLAVGAVRMAASDREASGRYILPPFATRFVTIDDVLLPLQREIIRGNGDDEWDVILSPGRVWSEPGDRGMSRASFPFTLVTDVWNEAHNGVATFLYDDASTSHLRLQVTQETAPWNQVDFWAVTSTRYTPEAIDPDDPRIRDFEDERARRVTTKPWPELAADFPGVDVSEITRGIPAAAISSTGILVDDVLYYQESSTRHGPYPYPLQMRHGVFSVTKSAGAALTLLRLAHKYGEEIFDRPVSDYVDVTATHDGWGGVTFGHLLSMVAGIGDRWPDPDVAVTYADENDDDSHLWDDIWHAPTRAGRLRLAFGYGDYPWGPGEIVRYNSAHTFILGAAMDGLYKAMEGPGADVWAMMKDEVYGPIGIHAVPTMTTAGPDPLPIHAFGLYLNAYDTARIVQLLTDEGAYDGQQLLHAGKIRESLFRTELGGYPTFASVPTPDPQNARYLNSFWSFSLQAPGGRTVRVPYMWGYGGNFVAILPNGVAAYRYADGDVHDPVALALAAAKLHPVC